MFFGLLIFARILFVSCMILIIGYVFGSFSKNPTLTILTKIASIVIIFAFIAMNIFAFRSSRLQHNGWNHCGGYYHQRMLEDSVKGRENLIR